MGEALYILVGVAVSGLVLFLSKMFGGKKGQTIAGKDTPRTEAAVEKAAEYMAKRALATATADADKERVKKKLEIEDPVERIEAIAEELTDL